MSYQFSDFMRLIQDSCFPKITKEYLIESVLEPGLDDDEGEWEFPIKGSSATRRDYLTGKKLIPVKQAKDIANHFTNSGQFIEEYDNMLEIQGTRNRLLNGLMTSGIDGITIYNLSETIFHLLCTFLMAFEQGTDRITTSRSRPELETVLLDEANYLCPKCNKELIVKLSDSYMAENYDVYPVFPRGHLLLNLENGETIPAPNPATECSDDYLVLCKSHRKKLLEIETTNAVNYFKTLNHLKQGLIQKHWGLSKADITATIVKILDAIKAPQDQEEEELRIEPLEPKKKIDRKKDNLLYRRVCFEANSYYEFIRKHMSMLDDGPRSAWNKIASHISDFYKKYSTLPPATVYSFVTNRILELSTLNQTDDNRLACGYITSFFIQNCEVFDAFSK